MPTLADSELKLSAAADNTTLVSKVYPASNGDVFVVHGMTWTTGDGLATPTGGGQTWQPVNVVAPGGFNGWCAVWVCTVTGSPGSFAISVAPATLNNTHHSIVTERWTSAKLAGSPATNATVSGASGGLTGPSVNLTTVGNSSAISWCSVDEASQDPASRAYRLSATELGIYDGHIGSNSVQYCAAQANVGPAGTYAIGMTLPVNQTFVIAGVEIQDNPGVVTQPGRWGRIHP